MKENRKRETLHKWHAGNHYYGDASSWRRQRNMGSNERNVKKIINGIWAAGEAANILQPRGAACAAQNVAWRRINGQTSL